MAGQGIQRRETEFIDCMVASDPEVQYPFRMGLAWLNAHSERIVGKRFVELTAEQQNSLLEPLVSKTKHARERKMDASFSA